MIPLLTKPERTRLAARYLLVLRADLRKKGRENGDRAQGLGRAALAGGLVTLDLAQMHEQAVVVLAKAGEFTDTNHRPIKRAVFFFTQAIMPLEAAQRTTRQTNRHLRLRNETLQEHTLVLAQGNRRLQREVARRKAGEESIRLGKEKYQTLFLESQIMHRKLRLLTRQILQAQEEERKEISRELHDEVVQTLVGINVQLSALSKSAANGVHSLKAKIASTQRLVENSVDAVHRFARELRPVVLDDLGLIPALHAYSLSLAERKKLKIQFTAFGGVEALGNAKRTVLYRVAQEALTNVARHSHATQVGIKITKVADFIRMEISDNGKSFPVQKTLVAKSNKRLGLIGMRERVEMIGGNLTIESAPGLGTRVCAEVPFIPEKPSK